MSLETMTARIACQCTDAEGVTGSYLFTGEIQGIQELGEDGHQNRETLGQVSPTFPDLLPLFDWIKENGWISNGQPLLATRYTK